MKMTDEQKKAQSVKMKAIWKRCEKFGVILKKPKEEVFNNLTLVDHYSKQLRAMIPHFINLVLKEGVWKDPYDESAWVEKMRKHKEESDKEVEEHNEKVMNKDKENFKKENAMYTYSPIFKEKDKENDPLANLKLMIWVVNKIGSIEGAEKILQAVKLSMESMK